MQDDERRGSEGRRRRRQRPRRFHSIYRSTGSTGRTWGGTAGERPEERIIGGDACAPVAFAGARCACAALTRATADTWAEGKEEGKCGGVELLKRS
uniref:Uncharacterized protein n=1 Tax=Zea mays TaxID=4577 RepID=A0A804NWK1_MAIZE